MGRGIETYTLSFLVIRQSVQGGTTMSYIYLILNKSSPLLQCKRSIKTIYFVASRQQLREKTYYLDVRLCLR